jgi:hypothetical protein
MSEFMGFVLIVAAVALLIFGIGAYAGWSWAVRPVEGVPVPRWIGSVWAVAGVTFVGGQLVRGEPAFAFMTGVLFVVIVGSALRIGPFGTTVKTEDGSGD